MKFYRKQKIERIVIFGDSLSDAGIMYSSIKGKIFLKLGALKKSPKGRFTDGRVWCDWLDDYILSRCLEQKRIDFIIKAHEANIYPKVNLKVFNYAIGGATAGHYGILKTLRHFKVMQAVMGQVLDCLDHQFVRFEKTAANSSSQLLSDLYIIWAGANDLATLKWDDKNGVDYAIKGIFKTIDKITKIGGKNFLLINLPALAVAPRYQNASIKKKEHLDDLVNYFNASLENEAMKMKRANIEIFDSKATLDELHANNYQYLIFEGHRYNLNITNSSEGKVLVDKIKNGERYAYFDDVHPTINIHGLLGMMISTFLTRKFDFVV